jgi:hypothetical protein
VCCAQPTDAFFQAAYVLPPVSSKWTACLLKRYHDGSTGTGIIIIVIVLTGALPASILLFPAAG